MPNSSTKKGSSPPLWAITTLGFHLFSWFMQISRRKTTDFSSQGSKISTVFIATNLTISSQLKKQHKLRETTNCKTRWYINNWPKAGLATVLQESAVTSNNSCSLKVQTFFSGIFMFPELLIIFFCSQSKTAWKCCKKPTLPTKIVSLKTLRGAAFVIPIFMPTSTWGNLLPSWESWRKKVWTRWVGVSAVA